ncbi:MAG TPA: hypothetical protein VG015_04705 [Candidatus Dormibacteraeota bacterium]|jgi:hypothetical protein|nr:hypothetical protein [Candidatus Dormibacteraeota bacterium]
MTVDKVTSPDPAALLTTDIQSQIDLIQNRMRPLETDLAELRAERDLLLAELRRRERVERTKQRAAVKAALREGELPSIEALIDSDGTGTFDGYIYNLRTGGEVRLGFPGTRAQTLALTNGRQLAQVRDFEEARRLFAQGWELGSPGRSGVRVHFPGSRQEKLVEPKDVVARRPE